MSRQKTPIYLPRMRPLPGRRAVVVSVLDIGSTKVCCLIAKLSPRNDDCVLPGRTHAIEVLGYGYQRSRGLKSGVVVDMDAAEQAIRLAVDAAERMAGLTVESLITNVTCGRLHSEIITASVGLASDAVCEADIQRVLSAGSAHTVAEGRAVMHALPIAYTLDGNRGMRDPRGMIGRRLGVDMQVVTAEVAPVRNLELCINRGHLAVETMVATPYASGLSTLVEDETELGVACVDMGGGTTTLSVFVEGQMVHTDAIAVGGHHVTMDIARALSTRLADAERIKTLQGSALPSGADDRDLIIIHQGGSMTAIGKFHQCCLRTPFCHLFSRFGQQQIGIGAPDHQGWYRDPVPDFPDIHVPDRPFLKDLTYAWIVGCAKGSVRFFPRAMFGQMTPLFIRQCAEWGIGDPQIDFVEAEIGEAWIRTHIFPNPLQRGFWN